MCNYTLYSQSGFIRSLMSSGISLHAKLSWEYTWVVWYYTGVIFVGFVCSGMVHGLCCTGTEWMAGRYSWIPSQCQPLWPKRHSHMHSCKHVPEKVRSYVWLASRIWKACCCNGLCDQVICKYVILWCKYLCVTLLHWNRCRTQYTFDPCKTWW